MNTVSRSHPLMHYQWGDACDGWNFVDEGELSIKLESMPGRTEEVLHYHRYAQQFFFILKGEAAFEVDGKIVLVHEKEGIHIKANEKHRIINNSEGELEFILCSQPSTKNDRINIG